MGIASGKDRGLNAVKQVLNFPLIDISIDGAKGILFGISGGRDVTMAEINDVAKNIVENVDATAKVIFGAYHNRKIPKGKIKVTLIATNFEARPSSSAKPEAEMTTGNNLFEEMDKEVVDVPLKSVRSNNDYVRPVGLSDKDPVEDKDGEKDLFAPEKDKKEKKKSSEMWDIPAFLRKKKDR
jgi:cell division protein FtsZ